MLTLLLLPVASENIINATPETLATSSTSVESTHFVYSRTPTATAIGQITVNAGQIYTALFEPIDDAFGELSLVKSIVHSRTPTAAATANATTVPNVLVYRVGSTTGISSVAGIGSLVHFRQPTSTASAAAALQTLLYRNWTVETIASSDGTVATLILQNATPTTQGTSVGDLISNFLYHRQPTSTGTSAGEMTSTTTHHQLMGVTGDSDAASTSDLIHNRQGITSGISAVTTVRNFIQMVSMAVGSNSDAELTQQDIVNAVAEVAGTSAVDFDSFIVHNRTITGAGTAVAEAISMLLMNSTLESLAESENTVASYNILRNVALQIDSISSANALSNWLFTRTMNHIATSDVSMATPATVWKGIAECLADSQADMSHGSILSRVMESDGFAALSIINQWIQKRQAITSGESDMDAAEWIMLEEASYLFTDGSSDSDIAAQVVYNAQGLLSATSEAQLAWIANLLTTAYATATSDAQLRAIQVTAQTLAMTGGSALQIAAGVILAMDAAAAIAGSSGSVSTSSFYPTSAVTSANSSSAMTTSIVNRRVPQTIFAQGEVTAVGKRLQPVSPSTALSTASSSMQPKLIFGRTANIQAAASLVCQVNHVVRRMVQTTAAASLDVKTKLIQLPMAVGHSSATLKVAQVFHPKLLTSGRSRTFIGVEVFGRNSFGLKLS